MSLFVAAVTTAVAYTAVTYTQGRKAAKQNQQAMNQAQANADRAASQAQQDFNRANSKRPNIGQIMASAQMASRSGQAGTMLTGAAGVDPNSLSLGKNTLLGQ